MALGADATRTFVERSDGLHFAERPGFWPRSYPAPLHRVAVGDRCGGDVSRRGRQSTSHDGRRKLGPSPICRALAWVALSA